MKLNKFNIFMLVLITLLTSSLIYSSQNNLKSKSSAVEGFLVAKGNSREASLKKIVWEKHWEAISNACKQSVKLYTIGIRETGELSIMRIAQGAKGKPHTILEKSVKVQSMKAAYGADWEKETKSFYPSFKGFVGHYDNDKKLIGLRTDGWDGVAAGVAPTSCGGSCTFLPTQEALKLLADEQGQKNNAKYFYTGDYDLHEVYDKTNKLIPEATKEKIDLLNSLNQKITDANQDVVPRSGKFKLENKLIVKDGITDYAMIQHGDQASYHMNQVLEASHKGEEKAVLVQAVREESPEPIGWNVKGVWYVTLNLDEHGTLRKAFGLNVPSEWVSGFKKSHGLTFTTIGKRLRKK